MASINSPIIGNALGNDYEANYCFLPAEGTRGGILLSAKILVVKIQSHSMIMKQITASCQPRAQEGESFYNLVVKIQSYSITNHTISAQMFDERHNFSWTFTGVYGPQGELEKKMFIRELKNLKQTTLPSWLIFGDFNLIYKEEDKNNGRLNRRLMLRFRRALNHMGVKEIYLSGRKYTWTNSQQTPTMSRIDRAFCTPQWEQQFPDPILQPMSSSVSDQCPLLLAPLSTPYIKPRFRFEAH
jgi:hypothetical protein